MGITINQAIYNIKSSTYVLNNFVHYSKMRHLKLLLFNLSILRLNEDNISTITTTGLLKHQFKAILQRASEKFETFTTVSHRS
jgi:hypothetical protein